MFLGSNVSWTLMFDGYIGVQQQFLLQQLLKTLILKLMMPGWRSKFVSKW